MPRMLSEDPIIPTAERDISMVADDARADRDGVHRAVLAYGEVRVGPGEIAIGVESLPLLSPVQRRLYDQAVAVAGVDPDDVLIVRVTETIVEVDALVAADAQWPARTHRVDRTALHRQLASAVAASSSSSSVSTPTSHPPTPSSRSLRATRSTTLGGSGSVVEQTGGGGGSARRREPT